MKKAMVTAIAITSIFIASLIQTSLAMAGPEISVELSDQNVLQGENFTVNITVDPVDAEVMGASYWLYFDNMLLNATEQIKGPFLSQGGASTMEISNEINNTIGRVKYGEMRIGVDYGVTTPGVLATITFKAVESGTSSLSLSNVVLSDPVGGEIQNVFLNNGTCKIEAMEQTPTPTPTSESGGSGNGDSSVTPTPTSTPLPSGEDNSNGNVEPTETPSRTPTQTPMVNPVPPLSQSPSPIAAISPTPTASMPSPTPEEHNRLPGFEAAFSIVGLLVISYSILKGKRGDKK